MGDAWSKRTNTYVYRYNTANPTGGSSLVEHAAENWICCIDLLYMLCSHKAKNTANMSPLHRNAQLQQATGIQETEDGSWYLQMTSCWRLHAQ